MSSILSSGACRIRDDLGVEFFYDPSRDGPLEVHWTPAPPSKLAKLELALYKSTRNRFLRRVGEQLGMSVVVV